MGWKWKMQEYLEKMLQWDVQDVIWVTKFRTWWLVSVCSSETFSPSTNHWLPCIHPYTFVYIYSACAGQFNVLKRHVIWWHRHVDNKMQFQHFELQYAFHRHSLSIIWVVLNYDLTVWCSQILCVETSNSKNFLPVFFKKKKDRKR